MNNRPYPRGAARAIAVARANGMRPAEAVLIVLAGRLEWSNPTIYATHGTRYRWDWLQGLPVVVMIDATTGLDGILTDIEKSEPAQIDVIDRQRQLGWLILSTTPLKTVHWPKPWVKDWLSESQDWHRGLNEYKARATSKARTQPTFEPEAIWN